MFGPDQCGYSTRKTHVIFHSEAKKDNLQTKKSVKCETDKKSHRYTLIVKPDNTYEVQIDGAKVESGALGDDFDFLEPKKIKDPAASKPADWVDAPQMPDPEDVKPAGWDDVPAKLPDAKATKPDDWDDDEDGACAARRSVVRRLAARACAGGPTPLPLPPSLLSDLRCAGEWEAPLIDNPAYKGEWKQKQIANPAYKGAWVHPEIDNPAFKEDPNMYHVCAPCAGLGFELWQVKSGTIFDDIIVTDSLKEAEEFAKNFESVVAAEKAEEEAEKAKKAAEEAEKKAADEKKAAEEKEKKADDADADDDDECVAAPDAAPRPARQPRRPAASRHFAPSPPLFPSPRCAGTTRTSSERRRCACNPRRFARPTSAPAGKTAATLPTQTHAMRRE